VTEQKSGWLLKGVALLVIGLIIGTAIGILVAPPLIGRGGSAGLTGPITIGALLSLSGDLRTFGENEKAALELAQKDINNWLAKVRPGVKVQLAIEDTATKPQQALEKVQALAARGIKFIAGPLSSGEVRNIKTYADENNILIVSQSSTATDLSVPKDNVFRFITDDAAQGPALARLMYATGIRYYIPIWRGDTYGDGLKSSTEQAFKRLGGNVDAGVRYNPEVKEFTTEVAALADKVRAAISTYGKERTAVHLIAFEEAVTFFNEAAKQPVLKEVRWYGSDGTALSGGVADDPVSAKFSRDTKFLNTIFAPTRSDIFNRVRDTVKNQVGREPDSYSYTMYDILWVLTQSILMANAYDPALVKELLPTVAGAYFGASGWTVLNENGDRKTGDYDIWVLESAGDKSEWKLAAVWSATSDSITFVPGFEKYQ